MCVQVYVAIISLVLQHIFLIKCRLVEGLKRNIHHQGRHKQSPDGQAQLAVVVKLSIISRAKRAAKFWTLLFLAIRRRSHSTSASNWEPKAWKFHHTERRFYVRMYPAGFYYSNIQSGNETTQKHNYVWPSAENGPAMAGPAGPVLAPMITSKW